MIFATPWHLGLLPTVAILIAWRWWWRPRATTALTVTDIHLLTAVQGPRLGWRIRMRWVPRALRVIALLLLVIAIARPQRGLALTFLPEQGIDIVLVLDLSGSMSQPTGGPGERSGTSKLEAARTVVEQFINTLEGNRVGLVIFQARSLVMSPLTVDRAAVQRNVKTLEPGLLPDGTAIGLGITEGLNLLRTSEARSRVVVLLTDGQNNAGEVQPLQAAQLGKALGIRIYTIGFVQRAGDVDETVLQRIATETGGSYYNASTQEELGKVYDEIGALERSFIGERRFTRYQELSPWLVAVSLAILTAEAALRASVWRRYP